MKKTLLCLAFLALLVIYYALICLLLPALIWIFGRGEPVPVDYWVRHFPERTNQKQKNK